MTRSTTKGVPTNAEIVRLLQAVQIELREVRRSQKELDKKLGELTRRKADA